MSLSDAPRHGEEPVPRHRAGGPASQQAGEPSTPRSHTPVWGRSAWLPSAWAPSAWLPDVLIIAVVVVVALVPGPGPGQGPPHPGLSLLEPAAVCVAVLLVPLRRRWPAPVLAAGLLTYCGTALLDVPSTAVGIAMIVCAYSLGARTGRLKTLVAGGTATLVVVVLSVTVSTFGVVDPRVFQIAAALAVAAALGDSSRSHRGFVRAATERAERAEATREAEAQRRVAEERLRIAQDLHDTVAHQISVISLNAGVAANALESSPDKVRAALGTIRTSARGALSEIGDLLRYLRTESGPAAPPQPGLGDVDALVSRVRASGLEVLLEREGELDRVTGTMERVVFRIVQEGLTNAHKHGSGRTASVRIAVERDGVTVTVANPLSQADRNQAADRDQAEPPRGGLGLTGICERVASVRGTVTTAVDGNTFALTAHLPLRGEDRP